MRAFQILKLGFCASVVGVATLPDVTASSHNKVRAAYSSISGIFTPVWIATEERLYQKTNWIIFIFMAAHRPVSILPRMRSIFLPVARTPIVGGILIGPNRRLSDSSRIPRQ